MENLYDELLKIIKSCVREISFQRLSDRKRMLIIAINEEGLMKDLLQNLLDGNPNMEMIFIAQPRMVKILQEITDGKALVLAWQGAYTMKVADYVKEKLCGLDLDGFLFFSNQSVDLRSNNLIGIAEALSNRPDFIICGVDVVGTLYEYQNIELYNRGIKLYEDANLFLDLYCKLIERHGY